MTDRELMQQALEALEEINKLSIGENAIALPAEIDTAMDALRERLAQPEQEPVAWMHPSWIDPDTRGWESDSFNAIPIEGWVPLYTAPRQWQGLTDDEREHFRRWAHPEMIEAIELRLQERNT